MNRAECVDVICESGIGIGFVRLVQLVADTLTTWILSIASWIYAIPREEGPIDDDDPNRLDFDADVWRSDAYGSDPCTRHLDRRDPKYSIFGRLDH